MSQVSLALRLLEAFKAYTLLCTFAPENQTGRLRLFTGCICSEYDCYNPLLGFNEIVLIAEIDRNLIVQTNPPPQA